MLRPGAWRLIVLCPLLLASDLAQAAINILVSFTVVETEVSPEQRVLSARHTSAYTLEGHSIRMRSDTNADNEGVIGTGHVAHKSTGTPFVFQATIRANHLVLKEIFSTEVITTTIDTNGRDSCTATRTDMLKAGQRFYQGTRPSDLQHIVSIERRYEDVTCVISE